jgi:hypothetical protein
MSPEAGLEKQIEHYRRMTGEERVALALRLHEFACEITREGIRSQHPGASEAEVERMLRQRIALSHTL